MDRTWSHRGVSYRVCLVSLLVGIWPFLLGFGAPDWLWFKKSGMNGTEMDGTFGLWELCVDNQCSSNPVIGNEVVDDWFIVVVILQTLALPFYILALVLALLQNFTPRSWLQSMRLRRLRLLLHRDSETPEDLAFVAGFLGFVGIIVFMIMTSEEVSHGAYYSWGFAMSFTAASILVITGVIMCKTHSPALPSPTQPSEPRVVHTMAPAAAARAGDPREPWWRW
ncbi:uncharacterized protein LOC101857638 isoform X2 [Aplysia californica]|nr:uncharacterized protein LOC101857638 isoform X2 [Aplysia californica]XP_005097285.1 uncharacterized protein LOC101857638 isoform X2 [Aplysia californica]